MMPQGSWIWAPEERQNQFVAFARTIKAVSSELHILITASYHYELFVNGRFVNRGPVHGDPQWCQYDDLTVPLSANETVVSVLVVVNHSSGTHIHTLTPAPAGFLAHVESGETVVATDSSWRCMTLPMWRDDTSARGWALGYVEDYDARLEPSWWQSKLVAPDTASSWQNAVEIDDSPWGGYQSRITPFIKRTHRSPVGRTEWVASGSTPEDAFGLSELHDTEPLAPASETEANAFTFDFGRELAGFPVASIEADAGTAVELSWCESLRPDGRPWIFRKGCAYSARYICRDGRQEFHPFAYGGFRYIHIVVRNARDGVPTVSAGAIERHANLAPAPPAPTSDGELRRIYALCRDTLIAGAQEHMVDCPSREQSPAFADGLVIGHSLWDGFGEDSFLRWYLEAFIRAPLNEHGLFCGRYPGTLGYWLDFCLVPLLAQELYKRHTGGYYRPEQSLERAIAVSRWFEKHRGEDGLVDFPFDEYYKKGLRNFIDHPGLGMHNAPHRGIDRDGASCPLNIYYYAFLKIADAMSAELRDRPGIDHGRQDLGAAADSLKEAIRKRFFDGSVFHDAAKGNTLSEGTSWQTNSLAVCMGIAEPEERRLIMTSMIEGYDSLCRATAYFYYFFLPALELSEMREEAYALIKRDFGAMVAAGATTAWEGFLGDHLDSLCHPFSTPPFLYLLRVARGDTDWLMVPAPQ